MYLTDVWEEPDNGSEMFVALRIGIKTREMGIYKEMLKPRKQVMFLR